MRDRREVRVLVVGAGPAGIATAAALGARGISYRLVERGPVSGYAWRNAYDSLTLHTGRHRSTLAGMSFPAGTPLFPSKDQFWSYLTAYAKRFAVAVETNVDVRRVRRENGAWLAETSVGPITARTLVMATGIMSNPRIPNVPHRASYRGRVLHSVDYHRPADVAGGANRVLVVGVGNSGGEIASELGHAGFDVTVAVRSGANVVPRQIAGIPIQYLAIWMQRLPRGVRQWIATQVQALGEARRGPPVLPRPATSALDAVPLIGFHLVDAIRAGQVKLEPSGLAAFTPEGVRFTHGNERQFDTVLLATGFDPALAPLGDQVHRDGKGFAIRSDRVTSADHPNLYFVGQNYDVTGGLSNIRRDALLVAERLTTGRA